MLALMARAEWTSGCIYQHRLMIEMVTHQFSQPSDLKLQRKRSAPCHFKPTVGNGEMFSVDLRMTERMAASD
jgi:hypothetical protein